jgi:WD40 repeat protein/type II secretory pathway predicted ATPase ExeA
VAWVNRQSRLALDLYSILVGAFLGLATNYASSSIAGFPVVIQDIIKKWSALLAGFFLLLLIIGRIWQDRIEKPVALTRMWDRARSPYPGLESFTQEDAAAFFGRDREIRLLLDRLNPKTRADAKRCVPVVGPSGSGKSSLIQAGLLPQLATKTRRWVLVPTLVPSSTPIRNLARSIAACRGGDSVANISERLLEDPNSLGDLLEEVRVDSHHRSPTVLLVIDQAEELFTMSSAAEAEQLLTQIENALKSCSWLWVLLVFRPEFLTQFLRGEHAALFEQPVTVGPLTTAALYDVIERPAAQAGVSFEPRTLINRMVSDTGGGEALPLLAWTLSELWSRIGQKSVITEEDYDKIGGVGGALTSCANSVAEVLTRSGESYETILNTLLRFFFLRGNTFTRRRIMRSALNDQEWTIAQAFIEARLLSADVDPGTGEMVIQVAHEAIIEYWPPLKQIAESKITDLERISRLDRWATEWIENGRLDEYLLSGSRLDSALSWASTAGPGLTELPHVQEFLEYSTRADQVTAGRLADSTAKQALEWLAREPELAIMATVAAESEYRSTELTRQVLIAGASTTRLRRVLRLGDAPILSLDWFRAKDQLAIGREDGSTIIWDAGTGRVRSELTGHQGAVRSVAWSPDGGSLATASEDRTVRIWDAGTGRVRSELTGHESAVTCIAWSPGGETLASGSDDWTLRIWDLKDPRGNEMLVAHDGLVTGVSWAPDGTRLASSAADHSLRLWSVQPYRPFVTQRGHDREVTATAWSADGTRIASACLDGSVRIWSANLTLLHHDRLTRAVGWGPDGKRLATAAFDGTVKVWDSTSGKELSCFRGHESEAVHLAWAPDNRILASTSRDRTIRLWDTEQNVPAGVLRGHSGVGTWVAWHPDGTRFASASRDCTVRIWQVLGTRQLKVLTYDVGVTWVSWSPDGNSLAFALLDRTVRLMSAEGDGPGVTLRGHTDEIWGAAWSPDGARIATAAFDGTIRIWDAGSGAVAETISGHDDAVFALAWSKWHPAWLVSTSRDQAIRLWDIERSRTVAVLRGHNQAIWGLAWSPDGTRLATSSDDGEIRLWDIPRNEADVLTEAANLGLRALSPAERSRFLLPPAGPAVDMAATAEASHEQNKPGD